MLCTGGAASSFKDLSGWGTYRRRSPSAGPVKRSKDSRWNGVLGLANALANSRARILGPCNLPAVRRVSVLKIKAISSAKESALPANFLRQLAKASRLSIQRLN